MAIAIFLAALAAQAEPQAEAGPRPSFIICPGHPRCPRGARGQVRVDDRLEATRGFTLARPEAATSAAPPAEPEPGVERKVFFGVNAAMLDDQARAVLGRIALWLRANPQLPVSIEGHADSRGSRQANLALALRRAEAVRDYLIMQGVAPGRLTTISYGEERPALYDYGESVWMMNRRVEIRVR
jgi:peptidoglycan-associated lipoprotein